MFEIQNTASTNLQSSNINHQLKKEDTVKTSLIVILMAAFLFSGNGQGQEKQRMFMGADKCKPCHMSPKKGAQYKVWKDSKHSKAFETLASDKAKEIGTKKGIANPQADAQCLKCHVDGFGVDQKFLGEKYNKADGVGCESCHGPGGDYWTKEVMTDISLKKIEWGSVGLTKPDSTVCKKCHNEESPSYTGFNFDEMYKKIAHPMPEGTKTGG